MKKNPILLATLLLLGAVAVCAQQPKDQKADPSGRPMAEATAYHVSIQLYELEGEKRINRRSYELIARPSEWTNLRNGLSVPVPGSKETSSSGAEAGSTPRSTSEGPKYQDVGLMLQAKIGEQYRTDLDWVEVPAGTVGFDFNLELTSLATEQQVAAGSPPVLRVTSERVSTIVPLDKPTVIADLDEVNSTRRMEAEVTIAKMKF